MKAVFLLALFLGVVALAAAGRRYRDYDYDYDYDHYRRRRPAPREESHEEKEEKEEKDDHIYTFHVSEENHGLYTYHDEDGYAKGFEIDLLQAVCEHAHKECYFIMDKGTHCWYNEEGHEYPGMGLMAGWFDGCMGFFPTVERKNSFDFTHSFTKNMKVGLYYRKAAGLMNATDDHELENHRIGFVSGWSTTPACLDHQSGYHGNHIGEYTAVMFDDFEHLIDAVLHDEVDAAMAPKALGLENKGLSHTEPYFTCTTDGAAVMTQYGSEVLNWWDKAFDDMHDNGEFQDLCRKASRTHGHKGELYCN